MGNLTEHFSRHEFACKCGCGRDTIDAETLRICEQVRELEGAPVAPSSGHRCESYNRKIGGAKQSQHLHGRAADLPVSDPRRTYLALCELHPGRYGFGLYRTFVHVDTRSDGPARWGDK